MHRAGEAVSRLCPFCHAVGQVEDIMQRRHLKSQPLVNGWPLALLIPATALWLTCLHQTVFHFFCSICSQTVQLGLMRRCRHSLAAAEQNKAKDNFGGGTERVISCVNNTMAAAQWCGFTLCVFTSIARSHQKKRKCSLSEAAYSALSRHRYPRHCHRQQPLIQIPFLLLPMQMTAFL